MKKIFCIGALFSIIASFLVYFYSFETTEASHLNLSIEGEVSSGWEITGLENGKEVALTSLDIMEYDKTIILRREITPDWGEYDRIRIDSLRAELVFVDDYLVYGNHKTDMKKPGELELMQKPQEQPYYLTFSFEPSWVGKTITIVTRLYENEPTASIVFDLLDDDVFLYQHEAWVNKNALPGTMFGVLTLLLLGLFLFQIATARKGYSILLLAFASLLQMLNFMSALTENPLPIMDITPLLSLYFLFPLLYLQTKMTSSKRNYMILTLSIWSIYFIIYVATYVLYLPVPIWFDKVDSLCFILIGILLYYCFKERQTNWFLRKLLSVLAMFISGYFGLFLVTAVVNKHLNEYIRILFREASNLYFKPLLFWVFTTILFSLFILLVWELLRERIHTEKEIARFQNEQEILNLQMEAASSQLQTLRSTQEQTIIYRHDMRHQLNLLYRFAVEGDMQRMKEYLSEAKSNLDAVTTMRHCANETINLLLTAFEAKAEEIGVVLNMKVEVLAILGIEDTALCSLLSNALENAITAVAKIEDATLRKVDIHLCIKNEKLLISTRNAYQGKLKAEGKLFKSQHTQQGHGYGLKSMISIVEKHHGMYSIDTTEGIFSLSLVIPMHVHA